MDQTSLTVAGGWSKMVVRALEAADIDVRKICRLEGLSFEALLDPDARVERDSLWRLWAAIDRSTRDPALGLRVGRHFSVSFDNALSHLVASSQNLGEVLDHLVRFGRVIAEGSMFAVEDAPGGVALRYQPIEGRLPLIRCQTEFVICAVTRAMELTIGRAVRLLRVDFAHSRRASLDVYSQTFGCEVRFGQVQNAILIPSAELAVPGVGYSRNVRESLLAAAEEELALQSSPSAEVEVYTRLVLLFRHMQGRRANLSEIALEMGVSERTLQRRLRSHHISFRRLVDDARCRLARDALDTGASAAKLSDQLGFAGAASLHRAMRRWKDREGGERDASASAANLSAIHQVPASNARRDLAKTAAGARRRADPA